MRFIGKKIVNAATSGTAIVNQVIKKFWLTMLSVTLIYIGLTVKLDQLGWDVAIPILNCAFFFWGTYRVMRAEVQLTAMLSGGAINGMPDFKIGEVFAAWKKNVSLPNFKLADFFTKGSLPASLAVIRVWAYIVIGVNMYTTLILILKVENPWWLVGAFSGLISLGMIDIVRPGSTKLFLKIATVMAIVQVGFGLYMTFHRSSYVDAAKKQGAENVWQADEGLVQPVYESLKEGKRPSERAMATVDNIEAARDAQTPVSQAVKIFSGTQIQVTIKDLEPVTVYGIPDGRRTFTIEGKDPIIFIMLPDKTSPTGMSAVKNSLRDPSFTLVTEDGATDGGTVIVRNGRIALRLRVPPDTEQNIRSGMIRIAESTVTVKFK